jgi:hypothetical protein
MPKAPTINYSKLAAELKKGTGKKRKQTWTDRNYPADKFYRTYMPRTEASLAKYGPSYAKANDAQRAARVADHVIGRGRFRMGGPSLRQIRSGLRWTGGIVGQVEPQIGNMLTSMGTRSGRGMYGRGSYSTVGNSLIDGLGTGIPTFASAGDETGALMVTHSEFVSDIYGNPQNTHFKNMGFDLNPGLPKTFPFLSQIAANFEEYEMVQLMFIFKSKLSNNVSSTDGQVGSILMYTDYNPNDEIKTSKQAMMQSYSVSNGRVVDNILHGVECDPEKLKGDGHKFVRVQNTKDDLNDYDAGTFQVAVHGTPQALQNEILGELWVSYTALLRKSRVYTLYGKAQQKDTHIIKSATSHYTGSNEFFVGDNNGIGTELTKDGERSLQIKFPPSFAGPVKVSVWKRFRDDGVAEPPRFSLIQNPNIGVYGNIEKKNWLIDAFTPEGEPIYDDFVTVPQLEGTDDSINYHLEFTLMVEQAESGTDNTVVFRTAGVSNTAIDDVCDTTVVVERYNNYDTNAVQSYSPV